MTEYLSSGFPSNTALYNAQGNAFDRAIVGVRCGQMLAAALRGAPLQRHVYPDSPTVVGIYARLRAQVRAEGWQTTEHAIPADLAAAAANGDLANNFRAVDTGRLNE